ncbi:MAG: hypothetical protein H0X70_07750 [Segetibacter sp.]|nr:hypothetical protein [Segetibacter sp.]
MKATQIEVFNLLQKAFSKEEAEKIVTFISEQNVEGIDDLKKIFLTKDNKIDLLTRMDSHFKWLAGIVIAMFSLAIAILKIS